MERAQVMRTRRLPPSQVDCKWWLKGHCFRGAACYFRHDEEIRGRDKVSRPDLAQDTRANAANAHVATEAGPLSSSTPVAEPEKCGICLEVPLTYGLLVNCDHVFCLECLREWRASKNNGTRSPYSGDGPELQNPTKTCPMCRVCSEFIVPSSVFPTPPDPTELAPEAANDTEVGQEQDASSPRPSKPKNPAKEKIINAYLEKLKTIPCKYFEEGVKRWRDAQRRSLLNTPEFRPVCYFGNTCHYAHKHPVSNERYVFSPEELEAIERKRAHAHRRGSHSGGPFASLDPRMFENMMEAFGDFLERGSPSLGPPPTLPVILRALQEESLRHMGDAGIFLEMDDEDGFGGGGFDDDWEDYYTGDEEHDRDDDDDNDDEDDLPALTPLESSGSPPNDSSNDDEDDMPALVPLEPSGSRNDGSNDNAGFEDMSDLIFLSGDDSDDGFGDLPDLAVPLEHESSVTTPEDRAPGDSGDIADLISFIVGTDRNADEVPDLIEFD